MKDGSEDWDALSYRRIELYEKIKKNFLNSKFAKSELDELLKDSNTTTKTLNKMCKEEGYIERVQDGGIPILIANMGNGDSEAEVIPSEQEELARKMVNLEGLDMEPEEIDWSQKSQKISFCKKFNSKATKITLNPTYIRNKYRLLDKAKKIIESNT